MPSTQPPFLNYYNIVIVSVLALLIKLIRTPAGADFRSTRSHLVQPHMTGNSASQPNVIVYDCYFCYAFIQL
jgi:hypothetical protein